MTTSFIYVALVLALAIQFISACFWEGMILEPLSARLWTLPSWIKKPLYDCPICMTPWWGSLLLILGHRFTGLPLLDPGSWVALLLITGGINVVIVKLSTPD